MSAIRRKLVHEALKNLGALPEGTTPNAEDYASVDGRVDGVIAELERKDIVYVPDFGTEAQQESGQIPDHLLGPLGAILAVACASRFGAQDDVGLVAAAARAERDILTMESEPYSGAIAEASYF